MQTVEMFATVTPGWAESRVANRCVSFENKKRTRARTKSHIEFVPFRFHLSSSFPISTNPHIFLSRVATNIIIIAYFIVVPDTHVHTMWKLNGWIESILPFSIKHIDATVQKEYQHFYYFIGHGRKNAKVRRWFDHIRLPIQEVK